MASEASIVVPDGFTLHTENTAHVLLPSSNEAFLNPVQEFNRDLSVACIRVWSEIMNEDKEQKWRQAEERRANKSNDASKTKRRRTDNDASEPAPNSDYKIDDVASAMAEPEVSSSSPVLPKLREYRPQKIVILEALSATGLRSIRYAKEIPLVKHVLANDLAPSAVAAMQRNVEINGLAGEITSADQGSASSGGTGTQQPKVRVNEGDACALMYNHRAPQNRVDVVDLDPYGTAAPFIDAAVQCVNDGGLLCVTCTDLMVLATVNYPEKCFSNYGGIPLKAEYCHEAALRLVLHTISTSASRYGRYIEPLLSLSIDFYVRLFVRMHSAPIEVKKAASKTSMYYVCSGCQAWYGQPLARMSETVHEPSGAVNVSCKAHTGPTVTSRCPECSFPLHIAGPMWSGPLHNKMFVSNVLKHVDADEGQYGTATRMKGMLTVASEELNYPFYFTPAHVAGRFHCTCPALDDVASALLHAGHHVSRSHAAPGSLKTTARPEDIHDVFRSWSKLHPVKKDRISENSPAFHLLAKEPRSEANFTRHPLSVSASSKVKLVRYQQNPAPNWGPGTRAKSGSGVRKRKNDDGDGE